jgi:dCMP deaminase
MVQLSLNLTCPPSNLPPQFRFIFAIMNAEGSLTFKNKAKQHRYDVAYLRMATEWSKLSHCSRRQVGAIIVKNGMIISDGYNGTPAGFDNCCEGENGETLWFVLHAEANAITKVARSTNNAQDATLYLTLSPCKDCSKLVLQAGIRRVVFTRLYKDNEGVKLLREAGIEVEHIEETE